MKSVMNYNEILAALKGDCKYQGLFNLMITQTNKEIEDDDDDYDGEREKG